MCLRIRGSAPWPTEPKPTITRRLRNWASFPISNPCAAIVFVSLSPATFADSVNSDKRHRSRPSSSRLKAAITSNVADGSDEQLVYDICVLSVEVPLQVSGCCHEDGAAVPTRTGHPLIANPTLK